MEIGRMLLLGNCQNRKMTEWLLAGICQNLVPQVDRTLGGIFPNSFAYKHKTNEAFKAVK
jgi:hypothetical protein